MGQQGDIVAAVEAAVRSVNKTVTRNMIILAICLSILPAINTYRIGWLGEKMDMYGTGASQRTKEIAEIKTRQDLYRQQQLDYIKDMIDTIQTFQDKNKHLQVPKWPVPRPLGSPGTTTESDLRRIPQTASGPTPTPIVKTITKTKIKRIPAKPTPVPFLDWFRKTR